MFESQMLNLSEDVIHVNSQEDAPVYNVVKTTIANLKRKFIEVQDKTPDGKRKAVFSLKNDSLGNDDSAVRATRSVKAYSPVQKKKKDPAVKSADITTTRRPTRKPAKWCGPVE